MADRYLLESGAPDGYQLEDGSGVLLLEVQNPVVTQAIQSQPDSGIARRISAAAVGNLLVTTLAVIAAAVVVRAPVYASIQRPAQVTATQQGGQPLTLRAIPAPFVIAPGPTLPRLLWQPDDTSAGTPKALGQDAQAPTFVAPQFGPQRLWQQSDTSRSALLTLRLAPIANAPQFAPSRSSWQPDDSSASTALALQVIPAPVVVAPQFAPPRLSWQPDDSSSGTPKGLSQDAQLPVRNPTSSASGFAPTVTTGETPQPLTLQVVAAPFVPAPNFAPLRLWWQPDDSSAGSAKGLTQDAQPPTFSEPQFTPQRPGQAADTSQSTPAGLLQIALPLGAVSWASLQRFFWQPNDTSSGAPLALQVIPAPVVVAPSLAPAPLPWQPNDTSQSAYGVIYVVPVTPLPPGNALFTAAPQWAWQTGDTTQESPSVAIQNVPPGAAVFPNPADVRDGIVYGPTGAEFLGTFICAGGGAYTPRRSK